MCRETLCAEMPLKMAPCVEKPVFFPSCKTSLFASRFNRKKINARRFENVDFFRNSNRVRLDLRSVAPPENEHGYFSVEESLLVPQILISGHQDFKAGFFREREQYAILLAGPAELKRAADLMP